jgi:hypothetical protein
MGRFPLALLALGACAQAGPVNEAPAAPLPYGKCMAADARPGLRATIDLADSAGDAEPVTDVGAPATLRYTVVNGTSEDVVLWRCGFWPNHRLVVLDVANAPAAARPLGEKGAASFGGPRTRNVEVKVAPGASDTGEAPIDLAALYDLDRPGRYTARVDYEDDNAFSSNTLTFWRAPAGARAVLDKLNGWPRDEIDVFERPRSYPGRVASGETNGFLGTHKTALHELGVDVQWDAMASRYRVAEVRAK